MSSCWNCGAKKGVKQYGWRELCRECASLFGGN